MSYFVLFCSCVFQSPSIAITLLGEERANFSAFRTFVRFLFVWFCRFPLPLGKGLWFWHSLDFFLTLFSIILRSTSQNHPFNIIPAAICLAQSQFQSVLHIFMCHFSLPLMNVLSVTMRSDGLWSDGLGRVCNCGIPWTFLLPFFP